MRSLAVTVASVVAFAAVLQVVPVEPPVLTGSDRSMQQYALWREHGAAGARFDWVVFGSSFARQSVDPRIVDPVWSARLGREVRGYNFGTGGLGADLLEAMVELALGAPEARTPELAVLVIAPSMLFTQGAVMRERRQRVATSPYGEALGDGLRWRGALSRWLLDRVRAVGLRSSLKRRLLARPRDPALHWERLAPDGRRGFVEVEPDEETGGTGPGAWRRFGRFLEGGVDLRAAARRIAAALARARAHGVRELVIVEGASHPRARARMRAAGLGPDDARRVLVEAARASGATAVLIGQPDAYDAASFRDPKHLTPRAAARYSRWLGDAVPIEDLLRAGQDGDREDDG